MRRFAALLLVYGLILAGVMLFAGCVGRGDVPLELRDEWDRAQAMLLDDDPSNDEMADAALDEIERLSRQRAYGPLADLLLLGKGAAALELIGLVASRRKRKLYGSAIKNLSSGQLASAAGDALKAWGAQHSSPQPPQPPQPSA